MSDMQIIRPGDTVLIRLDSKLTPSQAQELMEPLKDRFPDCELVFLYGVAGIDVYRPDAGDAST